MKMFRKIIICFSLNTCQNHNSSYLQNGSFKISIVVCKAGQITSCLDYIFCYYEPSQLQHFDYFQKSYIISISCVMNLYFQIEFSLSYDLSRKANASLERLCTLPYDSKSDYFGLSSLSEKETKINNDYSQISRLISF